LQFGRTKRNRPSHSPGSAGPLENVFSRVPSDYASKNQQSKQDKEQAKECQADQKFPHVVGVQANPQEQHRDL